MSDLETARRRLANRERIPKLWETDIGYLDILREESAGAESESIRLWAMRLGLTGVVWTSLPPKFDGKNGVVPTSDDVIAFLQNLDEDKRAGAEAYVRQAPSQIDTPYRRLIEQTLGWRRRS